MSRALDARLPVPDPKPRANAPPSGKRNAPEHQGSTDAELRADVVDRMDDRARRHALKCSWCQAGRDCPMLELFRSVRDSIQRIRAERDEA